MTDKTETPVEEMADHQLYREAYSLSRELGMRGVVSLATDESDLRCKVTALRAIRDQREREGDMAARAFAMSEERLSDAQRRIVEREAEIARLRRQRNVYEWAILVIAACCAVTWIVRVTR